MEKQRVVGLRIFDQPVHGTQYVLFRRLAHGILLVIRKDDHILPRVAKVAVQVCRHILDVIDTTS